MTGTIATSVYSDAALAEANPVAQESALRYRTIEHPRNYTGDAFDPPPAFEPRTPTEILLLHEVSPSFAGDSQVSTTAATIASLWQSIGSESDFRVNVLSIQDVTGNEPHSGLYWVGFDPCGMVVDEDSDLRLDILLGMSGARSSAPSLVGTQRPVWEFAGAEVFTALAAMPTLMEEAWSKGRTRPMRPQLPRLRATDERGFDCAIGLTAPANGEPVSVYTHSWDQNLYGHTWVLPTVRRL